MKFHAALTFALLFAATAFADAPGKNILQPCDAIVIGEKGSFHEAAGRHLYYGDQIRMEKHTFKLHEKVYELHCTPLKYDLNDDGITDYILQVAGTGNGTLFGKCDIYVYVSCPADAQPEIRFGHIVTGAKNQKFRFAYLNSYFGVRAIKNGSKVLLESVSRSEDNRSFIRHYYSFDRDGWMKQQFVTLDK